MRQYPSDVAFDQLPELEAISLKAPDVTIGHV
jgi:hypothetical protein